MATPQGEAHVATAVFLAENLAMRNSRCVKRMYLEAKRRLDTHPNRVNWARDRVEPTTYSQREGA